jgi:hypothetical protein
LFEALRRHRVRLEGMLLKPNMVVPGSQYAEQAGVDEVAAATVRCLREVVPAAVPGIVFLSGGQSDEAATAHLNAINRLAPQAWQLSFSYGRALQAPVLQAWKGEPGNARAAQHAFLHRATLNGAARSGDYRPGDGTRRIGAGRVEATPAEPADDHPSGRAGQPAWLGETSSKGRQLDAATWRVPPRGAHRVLRARRGRQASATGHLLPRR